MADLFECLEALSSQFLAEDILTHHGLPPPLRPRWKLATKAILGNIRRLPQALHPFLMGSGILSK
jgi:hypothetical protein